MEKKKIADGVQEVFLWQGGSMGEFKLKTTLYCEMFRTRGIKSVGVFSK